MSLQLHFGHGACSFVPHCLLEATDEPFEAQYVKLHKGEQFGETFLKDVNPDAEVPVLFDDGQRIRQLIAICTYLADRFPHKAFMPTEPLAKARVMETLAWFNNTAHTTFRRIFRPGSVTGDESLHPSIRQAALEQFRGHTARIEQMVIEAEDRARGRSAKGQPVFLGGEHFGPLDPYAMTLARWGSMVGIDPAHYPRLWAWVDAMAAHPPVARALERERITPNAFKAA